MKKIFLIFLFIAAQIPSSFSQEYQRAYGGTRSETATSIQKTLDGNYIMGGFSSSFNNGVNDAVLLKTTTSGTLLWSKMFGGSSAEIAYFVNTCSDGGYILTGSTASFGNGNLDVYLVRTDSDGNHLWSSSIGGSNIDFGWCVFETSDGGFLVTGSTQTFGAGTWDGYLVKTNSAGTLQWTKTLGGTGGDNLNGFNKTSDGGYIVTGKTSTNSFGSSDTWLVKLDANCDTMWTKYYGSATEESGSSVIQTADGGYIITGDIHNALNIHHASLLKTDSQGTIQWARTYGGSGTTGGEFGYDVKQTPDSGYVLVGSTPAFGNSKQIFVVKANNSGALQWAKTYGGSMQDDPWFFQVTADNGFAIAGSTESFGSGFYDVYLLKTDSTGSSNLCNELNVNPEIVVPPLSTRSGTTINAGGIQVIAATATINPGTMITDVCPPPVAAFAASSDSICINGCLNFTDQSTNSPTSWMWNFSGGNPATSTIQNPTNICYSAAGTFSVTLITSNLNGSDTATATVIVSTCTGILENNEAGKISITPNPFHTEAILNISHLPSHIFHLEFRMYDVFGKMVMQRVILSGGRNLLIERNNLTSGMYFYKVQSANETISTGKIVIE